MKNTPIIPLFLAGHPMVKSAVRRESKHQKEAARVKEFNALLGTNFTTIAECDAYQTRLMTK